MGKSFGKIADPYPEETDVKFCELLLKYFKGNIPEPLLSRLKENIPMGAWSIFCTPESFMNLPASPISPSNENEIALGEPNVGRKETSGALANGFQSSQQPSASSQDQPSSSSSSTVGVMCIDVKMVANYIVEEMLRNINSEICKNVQKFNHDFWWGSPFKVIENKKKAYKLWKRTVGAGCEWDHKKDILDNYGKWACNKKGENSLKFRFDLWSNIHYGFVGKHAGFLEIELINGAGWAQIGDNDKSLASWDTWKEYFKNRIVDIGDADFLGGFDDPCDQQAIKVGFYLYDKHKDNLTADILIEKLLEIYNNHKPIAIEKCEGH